jgi:hypothetical protein
MDRTADLDDDSDDEILLTSHTMPYKYRARPVAMRPLPQDPNTDESDDEIDLLPPRMPRRKRRDRYDSPVYGRVLKRAKCDPFTSADDQDADLDDEILLSPRKTRHKSVTEPFCPPSTTRFLDLPHEVILLCLWDLPFEDIKWCRTLNRRIRGLIDGCPQMTYRGEQDKAGVEENPYAFQDKSPSDRMTDLRDLEERWLEFRPTAIYERSIRNTSFPQVAADYYLAPHIVGGESTAVRYTRTCHGDLEEPLHLLEFSKPFVTFGTAFEEHDLIAAVHLYVLLHSFLSSCSYVLEYLRPNGAAV